MTHAPDQPPPFEVWQAEDRLQTSGTPQDPGRREIIKWRVLSAWPAPDWWSVDRERSDDGRSVYTPVPLIGWALVEERDEAGHSWQDRGRAGHLRRQVGRASREHG